jgi:tetratricopeptide (TPR) repeat protein
MKRIFSIVFLLLLSAFLVKAQDANDKLKQASAALSAKDYAKAYGLYHEAIGLIDPAKMDPSIYYYAGYSAYSSEKYNDAIDYFDKSIKAGLSAAQSWEYKAKSYYKLNDYANTVSSYEKAASLNKKDKDVFIYSAALSAYKGEMFDKAVELFTKSVDAGYKGETAQFYKVVILKNQKKDAEYKQALADGVQKFPNDSKLKDALVNQYVVDGNEIYQKCAAMVVAVNQKVKDGNMKSADDAYKAEIEKAKAELKPGLDLLQKAATLDAKNENANKLLEASKQIMAL